MQSTLLTQIKDVMQGLNKALHIDEIADLIIETYPNTKVPKDELARKISSTLANQVKKKNPDFAKPKNKQGGFRKGMYRLRQKRSKSVPAFVNNAPKVNTLYTGKAGEYAVISELLFWGYNASLMAVDDGVDVVASKENSFFHIQVKTSNQSNGENKYTFKIDKSKFEQKYSVSMFYVLVLRRLDWINDYVIFSSADIKRFINQGIIKDSNSISMTIEAQGEQKFTLNSKEDIQIFVNSFSSIV